jgi:hypothetical protein
MLSCLRSVDQPRFRGQSVSPCCRTQSEPRAPQLISTILIQTCVPYAAVSVWLTFSVLPAFGNQMDTPFKELGSLYFGGVWSSDHVGARVSFLARNGISGLVQISGCKRFS